MKFRNFSRSTFRRSKFWPPPYISIVQQTFQKYAVEISKKKIEVRNHSTAKSPATLEMLVLGRRDQKSLIEALNVFFSKRIVLLGGCHDYRKINRLILKILAAFREIFLYMIRFVDIRMVICEQTRKMVRSDHKKPYKNIWDQISQVGFAELKETADDRANISGAIIGAPIVGQQLAQYILTDHQDADCRPMIRLILSRQL